MSDKYCIEKPEDFQKDLSFDKFMKEIVETEENNRRKSTEEDPVRDIIKKSTQRPAHSIRFGR